MSGTDPLVRVRDLRYRYPGADRDVLRIPFLDVGGTGLTAVTGPSGAGKSTLIEILAGTLRGHYSGTVQVLGREWSDLQRDADRQRHLRRIGFIPQDYGLLTDRSVIDLLSQDLKDSGTDISECRERIRRALSGVALEGFEDRQVAALSGGQRQRVAIARMLARDVELVIADEPTANLDPALTQETVALLRHLAQRNPVLIITHDPAVAAACDRTIVLQSTVANPESANTQSPSRDVMHRVRTVWMVAIAVLAIAAVISFATVAIRSGKQHPEYAASPINSSVPRPSVTSGAATTSRATTSPAPTTATAPPVTSALTKLVPTTTATSTATAAPVTSAATMAAPTTAASSTSTTPTSAGYSSSTYEGASFSIDYPEGWVASHIPLGGNLDTTLQPTASWNGWLIRVDEDPHSGGTLDAASDPVIAALERNPSYALLSLTRMSFAGVPALRWEFEDTEEGVRLHKVDIFFIDANGNGWGVLVQAPQSAWAWESAALEDYQGSFSDLATQ